MTEDKRRFLKTSVFIIDVLLIINAYNFAYYLRNTTFAKAFGHMKGYTDHLWVMAAACVLIPVLIALFKVYESLLEDKPLFSLLRTLVPVTASLLMITAFFYLAGIKDFSRLFFGLFAALTIVLLLLERLAVMVSLYFYSRSRVTVKKILIIGSGKLGAAFYERIKKYATLGVKVIGIVGSESLKQSHLNYPEVLGDLSKLPEILRQHEVHEVVIAPSTEEYAEVKGIVEVCDKEGLRINLLPHYYEFMEVSARVEVIDGVVVMHLREVPLDSLSKRIVKRVFDIVVSLMAIVVFSPAYLLIAACVKLTSKGPVFYTQERISVENKTFKMLKFRTMAVAKNNEDQTTWTTKNDSRVTPFGAFLRKTSLDEIPQFFNVLMGNMSIVGPRPERPHFVHKFKEEIPNYMQRHYIKAGITGWAQVNGLRGDTSIDERISYDNYYIHHWSIWMDIKILFLTVIKGFINVNAY